MPILKLLLFSIFFLLTFTIFNFNSVNAAVVNLIQNPSMETGSNSLPTYWSVNKYGNLSAKLTYNKNYGQNKQRSYSIDLTNYVDGGVSIVHKSVNVSPKDVYNFSDYYISNTFTYSVLKLTDTNGNVTYEYLDDIEPANVWTLYSRDFTIPDNILNVSFIHEIGSNGSLTTDNYSIKKISMTEPIVSITFDDGWESVNSNALPILNKFGYKSTLFIITDLIDTEERLSTTQLKSLISQGFEIGSHSKTHPDLTTLNSTTLLNELSGSKQKIINSLGVTPYSFAIPYGSYNQNVLDSIAKYYSSTRSSDEGYNSLSNYNRKNVMSRYITVNTSRSEISSWLEEAKLSKTWLVLMYHQVDNTGNEYSLTPSEFEAHMDLINASGIKVKTYKEGDIFLRSQL